MEDMREDHQYPDPDDVPRFAWAGAKSPSGSLEEGDDYMNDRDMVTLDGYALGEEYQYRTASFDPYQQTDPIDENFDPEFQYQEDSDKYNQIMML